MRPELSSRFVWGVSLLGMGVAAILVFGLYGLLNPPPDWSRECRGNLKSWFTGQRAYWQEKDTYTLSLVPLYFQPERGNRYAYFVGPGLLDESRDGRPVEDTAEGVGVDVHRFPRGRITFYELPTEVVRQVGLSGTCPKCVITMACAAHLDGDATLDVWSISTGARTLADGTVVPGGELIHHVDDKAD